MAECCEHCPSKRQPRWSEEVNPRLTSDYSRPWRVEIVGRTMRVVGADGGDIALLGDCGFAQVREAAALMAAAGQVLVDGEEEAR